MKQGHPTDTVLPNGSGQIPVCQQTSAVAGSNATIHQGKFQGGPLWIFTTEILPGQLVFVLCQPTLIMDIF